MFSLYHIYFFFLFFCFQFLNSRNLVLKETQIFEFMVTFLIKTFILFFGDTTICAKLIFSTQASSPVVPSNFAAGFSSWRFIYRHLPPGLVWSPEPRYIHRGHVNQADTGSKMTIWVSWADPHQIMRIRIRQKRFEILKVHIKLFRLRQQFSFVRRPEHGRIGV